MFQVPVDLITHPYSLLEKTSDGPNRFPVAGKRDLAAMKLSAVMKRGLRRDFWDLYALAQAGTSFSDSAQAYLCKFGKPESDLYHVLKAMTYFADAEKEPIYPAGMSPAFWEQVKAYFLERAPELLGQSSI
jgi:hypothetical protein